MPFHGVITDFVAPDLTKPSLEGLAYLLEHPELWPTPKGKPWRWDFSKVSERNECGTAGCAYGIAKTIWLRRLPSYNNAFEEDSSRRPFGLDTEEFYEIFARGVGDDEISPAIVADRIRQHLRGEEITYTGA